MMHDTVLVLPTSGTTGPPKYVALTQPNIDASIQAWVRALNLTFADRCLNTMPIWHGSLISNVLTSHSVGATVITTPVASALQLWELIGTFEPTWLPLPAKLAEQVLGEEHIAYPPHPLRFVRLSKTSLPPDDLEDLGRIFKCPVLQSYGMTEAASGPVATETLTCRRAGSVGKPIHLEVKIDPHGQILIRGPSVMRGYAAGPWTGYVFSHDGWLQTFDTGHFDDDGFLYLTGRTS